MAKISTYTGAFYQYAAENPDNNYEWSKARDAETAWSKPLQAQLRGSLPAENFRKPDGYEAEFFGAGNPFIDYQIQADSWQSHLATGIRPHGTTGDGRKLIINDGGIEKIVYIRHAGVDLIPISNDGWGVKNEDNPNIPGTGRYGFRWPFKLNGIVTDIIVDPNGDSGYGYWLQFCKRSQVKPNASMPPTNTDYTVDPVEYFVGIYHLRKFDNDKAYPKVGDIIHFDQFLGYLDGTGKGFIGDDTDPDHTHIEIWKGKERFSSHAAGNFVDSRLVFFMQPKFYNDFINQYFGENRDVSHDVDAAIINVRDHYEKLANNIDYMLPLSPLYKSAPSENTYYFANNTSAAWYPLLPGYDKNKRADKQDGILTDQKPCDELTSYLAAINLSNLFIKLYNNIVNQGIRMDTEILERIKQFIVQYLGQGIGGVSPSKESYKFIWALHVMQIIFSKAEDVHEKAKNYNKLDYDPILRLAAVFKHFIWVGNFESIIENETKSFAIQLAQGIADAASMFLPFLNPLNKIWTDYLNIGEMKSITDELMFNPNLKMGYTGVFMEFDYERVQSYKKRTGLNFADSDYSDIDPIKAAKFSILMIDFIGTIITRIEKVIDGNNYIWRYPSYPADVIAPPAKDHGQYNAPEQTQTVTPTPEPVLPIQPIKPLAPRSQVDEDAQAQADAAAAQAALIAAQQRAKTTATQEVTPQQKETGKQEYTGTRVQSIGKPPEADNSTAWWVILGIAAVTGVGIYLYKDTETKSNRGLPVIK